MQVVDTDLQWLLQASFLLYFPRKSDIFILTCMGTTPFYGKRGLGFFFGTGEVKIEGRGGENGHE